MTQADVLEFKKNAEESKKQIIIGESDALKKVIGETDLVAKIDSTVLISGESGTGKELIASRIHFNSYRQNRPFVAINCASIPDTLLESELFGHKKGAFTGALCNKKGFFEQADKGIIFLDEISEMSPAVQAKLLRVLQEQQFHSVGAEKQTIVDVRVIAATNKNLEEEMEKGNFRQDLFYRINVIPIYISPLRERKEDIPLLVSYFLEQIKQKIKKEASITPDAMQKLILHNWPGNVRELQNTIEYAAIMAADGVIAGKNILPRERIKTADIEIAPYKKAKSNFERKYIVSVLRFSRGNVCKAAEIAGRYRPDFYNLMRRHGINPKNFRNHPSAGVITDLELLENASAEGPEEIENELAKKEEELNAAKKNFQAIKEKNGQIIAETKKKKKEINKLKLELSKTKEAMHKIIKQKNKLEDNLEELNLKIDEMRKLNWKLQKAEKKLSTIKIIANVINEDDNNNQNFQTLAEVKNNAMKKHILLLVINKKSISEIAEILKIGRCYLYILVRNLFNCSIKELGGLIQYPGR